MVIKFWLNNFKFTRQAFMTRSFNQATRFRWGGRGNMDNWVRKVCLDFKINHVLYFKPNV